MTAIYDNNRRRVCQFSCGAASAVATKMTLAARPSVDVVNAFVAEEHPDNQRFMRDCEKWFGVAITQLRDTKYNASAYEVFRQTRYIKGAAGASCSRRLKRELLDGFQHPGDVMVLGFTTEEQDRADRFVDANNIAVEFPLIDAGMGKPDCLALIERAGIQLPEMYRLGFNNANCIGCPKGGVGYWNRVRQHFPERFEEMAQIEEAIGPSAYLFANRETGERYSLRQLDPQAGRHDEPEIYCGFACLHVEREIGGQQ